MFRFENNDDKVNITKIIEKFDIYCEPKKCLFLEINFFTCKQANCQRSNDYMAELCQKSSTCEFGDLCKSLVKDILIVGLKDLCLTECLLRELVLTLTKAVQAGQATEEMKSQAEELTNSETPERDISLIKHKNKNRRGAHFQQTHQNVDKYDKQYSKFYASSHLRR